MYDDTLTVYSNNIKYKTPLETEPSFYSLFFNNNPNRMACAKACKEVEKNTPSFKQFIHSFDTGHPRYHQDHFSSDDTHWHMQFSQTITQTILESIVSIFQAYNLITLDEISLLMQAYDEANDLNDFSKSKNSFGGLKKGFLLAEQKRPTPPEPIEVRQNNNKENTSSAGLKKGFFLSGPKAPTAMESNEAKQRNTKENKTKIGHNL